MHGGCSAAWIVIGLNWTRSWYYGTCLHAMYSSQMEQTRQFLPGFDRRQRLCLMCPGRYEYEQPIERNEGHTTLYGNSKFLIGRMSLIFIDQHQVESDYKLIFSFFLSSTSSPQPSSFISRACGRWNTSAQSPRWTSGRLLESFMYVRRQAAAKSSQTKK